MHSQHDLLKSLNEIELIVALLRNNEVELESLRSVMAQTLELASEVLREFINAQLQQSESSHS